MRGKDLIGRPVIGPSGRRYGEVTDLLVDAGGQRLVALVLSPFGLFGSPRVLTVESVSSFGPDVVLVDDEPGSQVGFGPSRTLGEAKDLLGKRYIDRHGSDVGVLEDLIFDEVSGRVTGFKLSGGFIQDLIDGRQTVAASPVIVLEDMIMSGVSGLNLGTGIED